MDNTIEEAQKEGDTVITSTKLGKAASRHNLAGKNLQMFYLLQVSIIALEKNHSYEQSNLQLWTKH